MRKFFTLTFSYVLMLLVAGFTVLQSSAQSTVFSDDFNRAVLSPGGTPSNTYATVLPANISATTNTFLRLGSGATAPASGVSYVTGSNAVFGSPYSTVLTTNTGLVTWTFNFRWNRSGANPAPPNSGAYGSAIVLAGSSSTLSTGTGYAIIYGSSGTPDPIRLVAYSNGVTSAGSGFTDICTSGVNDLAATNNYASVRVTYDPSTGKWSLYVRDDGASAWADPSTGVTAQKGVSTVNNTYTTGALNTFGFVWTFATGTNLSTDIDNYKVTVATPATPTVTSITPTSTTAGSGAFSLTVNGTNFLPAGSSTVTWNGANRITSFISSTQLNAIITATDVSSAGTFPVGVTTSGAPAVSNTQNFIVNAAATPTLSITSPLAGFGSVCINSNTVTNSFSINGTNLDGSDVTIAALPGFSFSETPGGTYTGTLNLSYTGGGFTGRTVYVKFAPTAAQSYDGNISIAGGGLSPVSVPVTATGINTAATVNTGSNTVAGNSVSLIGSITAAGCGNISNYGFEYSTTAGFVNGTGTQVTAVNLNSGSFSKTVSGLTGATTYYYKAFATNGVGTAYGTENSFTTSSVVPVVISAQPLLRYTENFNDITNWSANFASGIGANHFSSVPVGGSAAIPNATKTTVSSATYSSGSSGGVQKGSGAIVLLATGSTDNSSSVAVDFYMDFTGVNAGTLSFDWASVNNSTGDRKSSLRVYGSTDGVNFTEITSADVLNFTNNVPSTGTVNSVALPASFNGSPTARLRFYYHNGTGGTTGSRPKISIDNLIVTGVASTPCATPTAAATSLTFSATTETTIQGSFVAATPAPNEYLVVMSTSSSLTSNPLDGQSYVVGDNVGDGTVIAKGTELNFTATGLTGATTYYFFVFSVNSVCTGGPKYLTADVLTEDATTVAGLPNCTAPVSQPTALTTVASINSIQGSFTATAADEYIVLQSTGGTFSGTLVNGVSYNAGAVIGNATVVQRSNATTFTASGLNPATQYYYSIFSINSQGCLNGPVYNTVSPLSGTETTLPLPVCTTPAAQPGSLSFNTSNNSVTATFNSAGSGYNYLVVMSTSASLSGSPVDNTDYAPGSSLGGGTVISNSTGTSFIATGLNNSTTYYFFIFSANKNCTGGTKYLAASPLTGNATTTNAPVNNYYFGNLHAHSDYSDGNKDNPGFTPANDYAYASASQGFDFLGISEHNHFSSLNNPGNELANYHLGVAQAAAFNASHSNFLALYGMEWGVISGGGHVVVYGDGLTDLFGWESNVNGNVGPNYDVYVPKNTYLGVEGLFSKVNAYVSKNAFATLAHPNSDDYNNLSNIAYDAAADSAIAGVAVESGPATSANTTYSNPSTMSFLWYYQKLLAKGYHLGPTIDHDNHNTTFGRTTAARLGVIAPALTQTDIIKAVHDMHFYATEDMDAKVDFTINTRMMGSIFEDRNAPSISVNLTDATNSTSNALIRVMFGIPGSGVNAVVVDSVFAGSLSYVDNNLANHATGYYYIDITNNGKRIVTSPIWYTRTCASSSDTSATVCDSFNWYGTVYTTSTIATKVFTTVGGCDSTVTLHLTVNAGPATATIALAGSDTGCPGAGVALTATATGSISAYQWLQNGSPVATTATGNYTALESGSYSVKATNLGNCSVVSANAISVTVADNLAPVPDVASLPVITGQCTATVTSAPTATDNCAGVITATTTDPLTYATQGTYTIHWIYNDGNGNTVTQEQTVTVADTEKPTITAPGEYSVVNDAGQCGATLAFIGTPVTADNCAVASVTNNHPSSYYPVGTTIVTWTVTDVNGNVTDTATQRITVIDNELPTIMVSNVSVSNTAGQCGADIVLAAPVTADNCGVATVTNNHPSTYFPVGTTNVIWTVTDNNGWTNTATQTVIVTDTENPIVYTQPVTIYLNAAGTATLTVAQVDNGSTDNCGINFYSINKTSFNCSDLGANTVTLTVTDINGNSAGANVIVTVKDNTAPMVVTQPVTVYLNAAGTAILTASLVNNGSTDNCGISSYSINKTSFNCANLGTNTVTLTVTDGSGNSADATAVVTVKDNTAPTVVTQPVTVYLNAAGTATVTASQVNNGSTDNCGISSYSLNRTSFNCTNLGTNTVILTVTDASGNSSSANAIVTVKDNLAPVITAVANQTFCTGSSSYTIPVLTAVDNCSAVTVSYIITGATSRTGTTNNASGSFNAGVSTITWTVKDASGNMISSSTTVTISSLPAAAITVSNADAFCNKLTLTASSVSGATYKWMSGSSTFATTQQISLGQANGDGIYQLYVTVGGCTSAAASYHFQKQNLISSYTILAFDKVDLGLNNIVASGSVGVTSNSGEAEFGSNSSVSSAGSFVKAKRIDKNGSNITITNPIYAAATGITLPTMLLNTASTNGLPNRDVAQNSVSTVNGNYRNLTLKKGSRTTLTGNTFGTIRVEQGAQVTFTAGLINIDNLQVVKGPRYGYSYVRFAGDAKILVSTSVTIGSQVYINPDNNNVTFYMGDKKSDEEKFTVNGGDTKVSANIYVPNGKLKVTGGYRYGDYGNGNGDCDRDDDDDRYYGQGTAYVNMTGLFVAEKVEGNGRNVIWNSFDCSAAPVPVLNTIVTQSVSAAKETITTSEEELKITVLPNPSTTYFSLKIESKYATPVSLRVMDSRGRVVDAKSKIGSNSTLQIGHNYASGTYYAEMIQGTQRKMIQLIKVRG